MNDSSTKEKIKIFEKLMEDEFIYIYLDTRHQLVDVPVEHKNNPILKLQLSYRFRGSTEFDQVSITAYLLFGNDYYKCVIPWETILRIESCNGQAFDWLPPVLNNQQSEEAPPVDSPKDKTNSPNAANKKPSLRRVK